MNETTRAYRILSTDKVDIPNIADFTDEERANIEVGDKFVWTWCNRSLVITVSGLTNNTILYIDPQGFESGINR